MQILVSRVKVTPGHVDSPQHQLLYSLIYQQPSGVQLALTKLSIVQNLCYLELTIGCGNKEVIKCKIKVYTSKCFFL